MTFLQIVILNNDIAMDGTSEMALGRTEESGTGEQSSSMGEDLVRCDHFGGGSEFDTTPRLRHIRRRFPEAYKELDVLRELVVGRYVREITRQSINSTRKYTSEVYVYRDADQHKRMLSRLSEYAISYPGKIILWTDEGDHLHVVHDCPHSNGQCRCFFRKSEDFRRDVRAPMRRYRFVSEMDELDWTNVFLYFIMQKRESNSQVWIGGRLQRSPDRDEIIRWGDLQTKSREILDREASRVRRDSEQEERYSQDGGESISEEFQTLGKKRRLSEETGAISRRPGGKPLHVPKKSKFQRISETVHTLLNEYFALPATHIRDILVYQEEAQILFDPCCEKAFQAACDVFTRKFIKLKLADLEEIYSNALPVFYSNSVDPWTYYHDRTTSLKFVNDLLKFQFQDDEEKIKQFLINVREWFNLNGWDNNPKMNAVCVIGPPNSGKNYFWDMFCALAYNVGHIGRVNNKTNQFALQECYGRRMVVGNEVSMEDGAKEDFKKLCEGTAFNIRVKYQGDKIFTKAPVLLISNFELDICYDFHFKDVRLHTIRWSTCGLLKESTKKPYPTCVFDLFKLYNVSIK